MPAAPLPQNEAERLTALHRYHVLDTDAEQAFDDIALLAAHICDTPIALISIIDQARQWFKAKVGVDFSETPRELAFCAHAILKPDELLIVSNAPDDPRFADNPLVTDAPHIRFYAGAPLMTSDGYPLGTLCAIDGKSREISASQKEALCALARQVVAQLELRCALYERTVAERLASESELRFRTILEVMHEGLVLKDTNSVIQVSNHRAQEILGLTVAQMEGRDSLDPRWQAIHEDGTPFPGETHPVPVCLQTGIPLYNQLMGVHHPDGTLRWISINAIPMFRTGESKPYAAVATFADVTERKQAQALIEQHMNQIEEYSLILEGQKRVLECQKEELQAANALLQALAITDGLTGLVNHRHFQEKLAEEFKRVQRYGVPLSLLLIDVDKFKNFNDTFGHPAGDIVLKQVAEVLKQSARETDTAARYGGEEFAVLLPGTNRAGAEALAERIREAIALSHWDKRNITVSIGVASVSLLINSGSELVEWADQALYESKAQGRNRVSICNDVKIAA